MSDDFNLGSAIGDLRANLAGEVAEPEEEQYQPQEEAQDQSYEQVEPEAEYDDRFSQYDRQFDELRRQNELLLRHIEYISQSQPQSQEEPVKQAPDPENEPISYMQWKIDDLSNRLDSMLERGQQSDVDAYADGVRQWVVASEELAMDPNSDLYEPNYPDARNYLYGKLIEQQMYYSPGMTEDQVMAAVNNWFVGWADAQRSEGNALPNVIWNWALDLGYNPPEGEESQPQEEATLDEFSRRKQELDYQQVPDIGASRSRSAPGYKEPEELVDFNGMSREEYAAYLDASGGLGGALRRLSRMAG